MSEENTPKSDIEEFINGLKRIEAQFAIYGSNILCATTSEIVVKELEKNLPSEYIKYTKWLWFKIRVRSFFRKLFPKRKQNLFFTPQKNEV